MPISPITYLPPLDTPAALTKRESAVLRTAHILSREDAMQALGIAPVTYDKYLSEIRTKHREAVRMRSFVAAGAPLAHHGGFCNRGFRRNG